jgi:hypothetical protein
MWVERARYLGVTLFTQLTWSAHVNQVRKKAAQRFGVRGPLLNRSERPVHQKRCAALQTAHPSYDGLRMSDMEVRCPQPHAEAASATIQVSSHCDQRTFVR